MTPGTANAAPTAAAAYLELLKRCLTREVFGERVVAVDPPPGRVTRLVYPRLRAWLAAHGREITAPVRVEAGVRAVGRDWPVEGETMIGRARLDNLEWCVRDVLRRGVPGDLIETGVWRGGATILMRGVLEAYGDRDRRVWVADSFRGLPPPDAERYPADAGDPHWQEAALAVPLEAVKANFGRYGLLDDQVRFLVGWFADTLPAAPIDRLAVLRLDGDMYGSTMEALCALYPKVSVGGYVIVDDYGAVKGCRAAVEDYRRTHGVDDPMVTIDWTGVYWRRSR